MTNKYLERVLEKQAMAGLLGKTIHMGSGKTAYMSAQEAGTPGIPRKRTTHTTTLRMGPHITPDDLLAGTRDMRLR